MTREHHAVGSLGALAASLARGCFASRATPVVMHVELLNPRKAIQVGNNNSNLKHGLPWRSSYYPAIDSRSTYL